ncbi:MAG: monovalent cation/H(+) antiporter subunit G [Thermoanaerobaculia bacterium]
MAVVRLIADLSVLAGLGVLTAALAGMLRFPDLWRKLHAAAIVPSLGLTLVLLGAVGTGEGALVGRALLIVALLGLAGPLTTHLIAHAARHAGGDQEKGEP